MPRPAPLLALLLPLLLIVGCTAADDTPPPEPVTAEDGSVSIVGTDRLQFDVVEVFAEPGELTIELICEPAVNHNIVLAGEVVADCGAGETDTGTVTLDEGTHRYVCNIPGHERTMQGTVTVE